MTVLIKSRPSQTNQVTWKGHSAWIYPIPLYFFKVQGRLGLQLISGQTVYSHPDAFRTSRRSFIEPHDTFGSRTPPRACMADAVVYGGCTQGGCGGTGTWALVVLYLTLVHGPCSLAQAHVQSHDIDKALLLAQAHV